MSHDDQNFVQAIPDPALLAREGRVTACNAAARALFPGLEEQALLPEALPERGNGAALVPVAGQYWQCTAAPCGQECLYILRAQSGATLTDVQLGGVSRRLREQAGQLVLTSQLLGQERADDPRLNALNQALCRLIRTTEHLDLLRELEREDAAPRLQVLDLAGLCMQTVRAAQGLLELLDVELEYDSKLTSLLVRGNSGLLEQMLLELVANAARAAGKGGCVTLSLSRQGDRALLSVSDSGQRDGGQPLGQLMAGQAVPGRLPQPEEGAGMGLALVQRIVSLHEGRMVMERREGVCVSVQLPLAEPGAPVSVQAERRDYSAGFSPALLALSDLLPASAFSSEDLE